MPKKKKQAGKKSAPKSIKIGKTVIPVKSEIYSIIEKMSKAKGQTIKKFAKENAAAIQEFVGTGTITVVKEVDYIITDIKKKARNTFLNRKRIAKVKLQFILQESKQFIVEYAVVYPVLNTEHDYDLKGNMYIDFPTVPEMMEFLGMDDYIVDKNGIVKRKPGASEITPDDTKEPLRDYLIENYPNIYFIPND